MQGHNESVKPGDAVQPQAQGEPNFTQTPKLSLAGDSGHPSMLEELAMGIPGSFVVSRQDLARSSSVGSVISVVQSEPQKKFTTEMQPVRLLSSLIYGPNGLDEADTVIGIRDGEDVPHRAYDAAVKAEAEKDATAQVIADLIAARRCLILAVAKLERSGLGSIDERVRTIAGINHISERWVPCGYSGVPILTATVNMKLSELLSVLITWQREVRP